MQVLDDVKTCDLGIPVGNDLFNADLYVIKFPDGKYAANDGDVAGELKFNALAVFNTLSDADLYLMEWRALDCFTEQADSLCLELLLQDCIDLAKSRKLNALALCVGRLTQQVMWLD